MTPVDIIKIIFIAALCVYSSYTDIRFGIIKNKIIVISISIGIILNIVGWAVFGTELILKQIANISSVIIVSVMLYIFRVWAGGDCKLMIAAALLIPYNLSIGFPNEWISFISVLGITFGLSYIYLVADSIFCAIKKKNKINKQRLISKIKAMLAKWISCIAYITLANSVLIYFFPDIQNSFIFAINICIVLLISGIAFMQNKYIVITVIAAGIIFKIITDQPIINKFAIINYFTAALFIILRVFIDEYNYETIKTSQVKKGMILSASTTVLFANSRIQGLPTPSTEDLKSRLTEDEANAVRKWEKSKYGSPTIQIVRKIPFAIFISLGTLLFIITGAVIK